MTLRPLPHVLYTGRYVPVDLQQPAERPARYEVWVHDGSASTTLTPHASRQIEQRSTSFTWGYSGAGPRQLALALMVDAVDRSVGMDTPDGRAMLALIREEGIDRAVMDENLRDPATLEGEWCIAHVDLALKVNRVLHARAFEAHLTQHFDALLRTPDFLERHPDLPAQLARMAMTSPDSLLSTPGHVLPGEEPVLDASGTLPRAQPGLGG